MRKLLYIALLLSLLSVLWGCGSEKTVSLSVEDHVWTFDNLSSADMLSANGFCNPDLAELYPNAMPMPMVLNQMPDNPLQFELVVGDTDINRYLWTFALVETNEKSTTYTVTDTGDGDGMDTPMTYSATVSSVNIPEAQCYTLVVETGIGTYTFTSPMETEQ